MAENYYVANRQLLLQMVQVLHQRGFEKLRIQPSLSPSGMHWRCTFFGGKREDRATASNWIYDIEDKAPGKQVVYTPSALADLYEREHAEFLKDCTGSDPAYTQWYSSMLEQLQPTELPFAFSDRLGTKGYWHITAEKMIKTLEDDEWPYS